MLAVIPEFSTMCMNAMEAFESFNPNPCKGVVFDSLVCNESVWHHHDSRDEEGVEVAADFDGSRACEEKQEEEYDDSHSRQQEGDDEHTLDTIDTISITSSINPAIIRRSADYKQRRHIKLDSFTTFLPYEDEDIFRSRRTSQGSDSQCFRLAGKLHRCTAFSQDSTSDAATSHIHPLKRDPPQTGGPAEIRLVHWDELVEDSVVNTKILDD